MVRLSRFVPGPLVRWFARPYVAGATQEAALDLAAREAEAGILATLDLLGEAATDEWHVLAAVAAYESLIDALGADPRFADPARRPSVSLKPSAFAFDGPPAAFQRIARLAERARDRGVAVTIDMEDRRWTEPTIEAAVGLFGRGLDVGAVLQTRLDRTKEDLERIPSGMRCRLVIGIYPEPASVATTSKPVMKERLLEHAARLLARGVRVEVGSHDEAMLERFLADVAPRAPERCEIQMLLGVPRERFLARLRAGELGPVVPFRRYVPFARSWEDATAYLRRRMDESPNLMGAVLRNFATLGGRR